MGKRHLIIVFLTLGVFFPLLLQSVSAPPPSGQTFIYPKNDYIGEASDDPTSGIFLRIDLPSGEFQYWALGALGFINELDMIQQISIPQGVTCAQDGDELNCVDVYGSGRSLKYTFNDNGMVDQMLMPGGLGETPTIGGVIEVRQIHTFTWSGGSPVMCDGVEFTSGQTFCDSLWVEDVDGNILYTYETPFAKYNDSSQETGRFFVKSQGPTIFVEKRVPWFSYKDVVEIDPTVILSTGTIQTPANITMSGNTTQILTDCRHTKANSTCTVSLSNSSGVNISSGWIPLVNHLAGSNSINVTNSDGSSPLQNGYVVGFNFDCIDIGGSCKDDGSNIIVSNSTHSNIDWVNSTPINNGSNNRTIHINWGGGNISAGASSNEYTIAIDNGSTANRNASKVFGNQRDNYWSFDGHALNAIGNLTGTVVGNTFENTTGCYDRTCWQLDGSGDYINIVGGTNAINSDDTWSVCGWAQTSSSNNKMIGSQGADEELYLHVYGNDGSGYDLQAWIADDAYNVPNQGTGGEVFHFCILKHSTATASLWYNGVETVMDDTWGAMDAEVNDLWLGGDSDSQMTGWMDEVSIFSRNITDREIDVMSLATAPQVGLVSGGSSNSEYFVSYNGVRVNKSNSLSGNETLRVNSSIIVQQDSQDFTLGNSSAAMNISAWYLASVDMTNVSTGTAKSIDNNSDNQTDYVENEFRFVLSWRSNNTVNNSYTITLPHVPLANEWEVYFCPAVGCRANPQKAISGSIAGNVITLNTNNSNSSVNNNDDVYAIALYNTSTDIVVSIPNHADGKFFNSNNQTYMGLLTKNGTASALTGNFTLSYQNGTLVETKISLSNTTATGNIHASFLFGGQATYYMTLTANDTNFSSRRYTYTFDSILPQIIQSSINISNITYNTNTFTLPFNSSDANPNQQWCQVQSGANTTKKAYNTSCSGSVGADGPNWVRFWADDDAGNINSTIVHFTVDTTAPVVTWALPMDANGSTVARDWIYPNASIVDANSNISTCILEFDGINESITPSKQVQVFNCGINKTGLAEGLHNTTIYANDSGGFMSSTGKRFVMVDTVGPTPVVVNPVNNTNYSASTTNYSYFNVTATDVTSDISACIYTLDGVNNSMTNSSPSLWNAQNTSMGDGTHTVRYYCNDTAGNMNNTPTIFFTIDTTGPVITFVSPTHLNGSNNGEDYAFVNVTTDETNGSSPILEWNHLNGSTVNYTMQGGGTNFFLNITGQNGTKRLLVSMNDTFGNIGKSENRTFTLNISIDNTPPQITVINPQNIFYNPSTINVTYANVTTNEPVRSAWYSLNGGANVTMDNSSTTVWFGSFTPIEGENTIVFSANDTSGNLNTSSGITYFTYDSISPSVSTNVTNNINLSYLALTFQLTVSDVNADRVWYNINGTGNSTPVAPNATVGFTLTEGTHNITIYGNDSAGSNGSTGFIRFNLDTTFPTVNVTSQQNISVNASYLFNVSSSEVLINATFRMNSTVTTNTSCTTLCWINFTGLTVTGNYTSNVTVCDFAGNCNTSHNFWIYVTVSPATLRDIVEDLTTYLWILVMLGVSLGVMFTFRGMIVPESKNRFNVNTSPKMDYKYGKIKKPKIHRIFNTPVIGGYEDTYHLAKIMTALAIIFVMTSVFILYRLVTEYTGTVGG